MRFKLLYTLFFATFLLSVNAQKQTDEKMQWFADAKLGIFIHWGIYSVNGISESWSFFNNYTPYNTYRDQLSGFTASKYDPQQWVNLIKESGAKYAVITSKHHDGVALWDSKQKNALTIPKHSAAKKDVLTPFVRSLKASGLKTGIYFSLPDWSYNDYDVFTREIKRYDIKNEPQRFTTFLDYYQGQLDEISQQFKPDLLWFDGDWEHNAEEWRSQQTRDLLHSYNPNIIINSRLNEYGDYATPEQGVPVDKPSAKYWELCYTMNDSWGFQHFDKNYKTPYMIIRTLVDCISMGGNLLLDIGPKADGTIPAEQVNILKELGRWTNKHAEAIYGTVAGIDEVHFSEKTALSKNRKTLFIYLAQNHNGTVCLRGLDNKIKKVSVVGHSSNIVTFSNGADHQFKIPQQLMDKDISVLKVEFEEEVKPVLTNKAASYTPGNKLTTAEKIQNIIYDVSRGINPFSGNIKMHITSQETTQDAALDAWLMRHAEVLANAGKGLSQGHYAGLSALSPDKQTIYLFVDGKPKGPLALKGIENNIARIRIVGDGTLLNYKLYDKLYWSSTPGIVYIDVPGQRLDKNVTIIAILLDGPVKEHRNEVKAIESNL